MPCTASPGLSISIQNVRCALKLRENRPMNGIQYLTDARGRRVAVQIDLKKHRELWEDVEDVLVSRARRSEKRVPLEVVKSKLMKSGKLDRA